MQALLVNFLTLFFTLFSVTLAAAPGRNAILLSNVQALTLRRGHMTSHRRVSPVPQLKCVGPSSRICKLYSIDTMRCTNQGHGYDEEDIEWSCTASLPPEFKLGSTDVICEGYRHSDDAWVLKGSCGVEYRLLLTDEGEKRYGHQYTKTDGPDDMHWPGLIAWIVFIAIFAFILYSLFVNNGNPGRRGNNPRGPGGGGDGGGGGGGWDDPRDPPPPYDYHPETHWKPSSSSSSSDPGFWTGAATGAATGGAAGYALGRRSRRSRSPETDPWEGSSRLSPGFSSSSSSTGFGSTKRR
ncbi:hypothetical protein PISL3812_05831 [Talaromyces islandicus]|uniref:Store-operated calcium entry-associated regulatory factor n=1 Tax=Talaromyces islandicus TaxID=28573 RepID=A0A0U1M0Z8_TALIS|nr:hypothetical protein PISL3812_05831 [Talaromyces islandicus]